VQWNSFGIAETPDDGILGPKYDVKGRSDRNSCITDLIILCINATGCLSTILYYGGLIRTLKSISRLLHSRDSTQ
jgi:hypothetical protein